MTLNLSEASHDLYVIGTQESALSEKEWAASIKRHLGDNYSLVRPMHTRVYMPVSWHVLPLPTASGPLTVRWPRSSCGRSASFCLRARRL
jgi:hypothetical protein